MNDERIKLILDLGNSGKNAAEVRQELEKLDAAVKDVGKSADGIDPKLKQTGESGKNFGQGMLSASYAVQDFTSQLGTRGLAGGLSAIQNNIPGILAGFGAGAGLTGVVSVAAVAVGLLADNFGKLAAAWSGGLTEAETERMNKLAEAAGKAAEAIQKQIDAARAQKSPDQSALGKAVTEQTGGPDFDKVVANAAGDMTAVERQKADLQRQIEAQKQAATDAMKRNPVAMGGRVALTATPESHAAEAKAKALQDQYDALTATAEAAVEKAQQMVVRARGGDMAAYDWVLANTTGDVHDSLAAADPRKAGLRGMAQAAARGQIADAIGGVMNPLITNIKDHNAAVKQGIDQDKIIQQQQDAAQKETEKVLDKQAKDKEKADKKAADDRDKALRLNDAGIDSDAPTAEEVQAMARRGEFGMPRQTYRPMSHADRIEANRRRKAGRSGRGGGGFRSVGVGPDDGGGGLQQAEQAANGIADAMGGGVALDVGPLMQALGRIGDAVARQQQQFASVQDQINRFGSERFTPWRGGRGHHLPFPSEDTLPSLLAGYEGF